MTTSHDWVTVFGFWCLPSRIQFGFSITSCYPRKPQGPIGHSRPPLESLYFLQTRLRGREGEGGREGGGRQEGHSPDSTQTLQTTQRVGDEEGERRHGASLPALWPINQTFLLRLCCSFPHGCRQTCPRVLSFQLLTDDEHDSLVHVTWRCSLRRQVGVIKAMFWLRNKSQTSGKWQLFLMQLYRGAALQPGLKTRQGFSYLLNSDLDQSGGLNSAEDCNIIGEI